MQLIPIIIIILIIIVLMTKRKEKRPSGSKPVKPSTPPTVSPPVPTPGEEPASSVRYSRNYLKKEKQYVTIQVLKYVPAAGIWTCQNCETENPDSEMVCCVCHKRR